MLHLKISAKRRQKIVERYQSYGYNKKQAEMHVDHYLKIQQVHDDLNPYSLIGKRETYEQLTKNKRHFEEHYIQDVYSSTDIMQLQKTTKEIEAMDKILTLDHDKIQGLHSEINLLEKKLALANDAQKLKKIEEWLKQEERIQKNSSHYNPWLATTKRQELLELQKSVTQRLRDPLFHDMKLEKTETVSVEPPEIENQLYVLQRELKKIETLHIKNKAIQSKSQDVLERLSETAARLTEYEKTVETLNALHDEANLHLKTPVGKNQIAQLHTVIQTSLDAMGDPKAYELLQNCVRKTFVNKQTRELEKKKTLDKKSDRSMIGGVVGAGLGLTAWFVSLAVAAASTTPIGLAIGGALFALGIALLGALMVLGDRYETKAALYSEKAKHLDTHIEEYCTPLATVQFDLKKSGSEISDYQPSAPPIDDGADLPPAYDTLYQTHKKYQNPS